MLPSQMIYSFASDIVRAQQVNLNLWTVLSCFSAKSGTSASTMWQIWAKPPTLHWKRSFSLVACYKQLHLLKLQAFSSALSKHQFTDAALHCLLHLNSTFTGFVCTSEGLQHPRENYVVKSTVCGTDWFLFALKLLFNKTVKMSNSECYMYIFPLSYNAHPSNNVLCNRLKNSASIFLHQTVRKSRNIPLRQYTE